jgi:hypothetical protein
LDGIEFGERRTDYNGLSNPPAENVNALREAASKDEEEEVGPVESPFDVELLFSESDLAGLHFSAESRIEKGEAVADQFCVSVAWKKGSDWSVFSESGLRKGMRS